MTAAPEKTEGKPATRSYVKTITAFVASLLVLIATLKEYGNWIQAWDLGVAGSLAKLTPYALYQGYFDYFRPGCFDVVSTLPWASPDCSRAVGTFELAFGFLPATFHVLGGALSYGFWSFVWTISAIGLAGTAAYLTLRTNDSPSLAWIFFPALCFAYIGGESLIAGLVVALLQGILSAIVLVLQHIGFVAIPTAIVNSYEGGDRLVKFYDSTRRVWRMVVSRQEA